MKTILRALAFLFLASAVFAQDIPIRDEGTLAGRAREINCVGAGISCSVSGGIAAFTFGTFASGTGLSFETILGPITVQGGDSGAGDPALIIDDPTDEYLIVRFPQFVQFNLDGGGGVLGDFYIEQGTSTNNLTVDNSRSANGLEVNQFNISVTQTDLTTSDTMSNTAVRSTYGTGGVASKGTLQNFVSGIAVQGIGDAADEYTALLSTVSVDIGTGYTQSTGPTGRAWGFDLNLLGPVGVQPNLLNGITQLMLNPYNGSPADTPSGGVWIITRPGTGGGIDATKAAATSYPIDVGLGIVGYSGASTTTSPGANGFTTGIQIGGHGSGWMPNTENSRIGTGIDISQHVTRGIYIHAPTGTPTADIETTGNVIIGGNLTNSVLTASQLTGTDASKNLVSGNLTGDVTTSAFAATIANDAVSNAKLANMADSTIKGRAVGGGTGDPQDLTAAQVGAIIAPASASLGSLLPNAVFVNVQGQTGATGNLDLYTVPAGKRAALVRATFFNTAAGSVAYFMEAKISGTYYRLMSNVTVTTGAQGLTTVPLPVFEPADVIAINTATNTGLNYFLQIVVFDDTSPLKSARLAGLSTGDNTLYTVPGGKSASTYSLNATTEGFGVGTIRFIADGGGSRTTTPNLVSSGGSPSASNKFAAAGSTSANTAAFIALAATMGAGDFININVDTGNSAQFAFVTIVEK